VKPSVAFCRLIHRGPMSVRHLFGPPPIPPWPRHWKPRQVGQIADVQAWRAMCDQSCAGAVVQLAGAHKAYRYDAEGRGFDRVSGSTARNVRSFHRKQIEMSRTSPPRPSRHRENPVLKELRQRTDDLTEAWSSSGDFGGPAGYQQLYRRAGVVSQGVAGECHAPSAGAAFGAMYF